MKGLIGTIIIAIAIILAAAIVIGAISYKDGLNIFEGIIMGALNALDAFFKSVFGSI